MSWKHKMWLKKLAKGNMRAIGSRPKAPENTTQFLMVDFNSN